VEGEPTDAEGVDDGVEQLVPGLALDLPEAADQWQPEAGIPVATLSFSRPLPPPPFTVPRSDGWSHLLDSHLMGSGPRIDDDHFGG